MYVSIDLTDLRILHIHPDLDICNGLLYLEGTKVKHATVLNTEKPVFLAKMTTLELNLLYRNATGADFPERLDDLARREALANLIDGMEPRKVSEAELDAQIAAVLDQLEQPVPDSHVFRYVFGAKRPAIDDGGLFPIKAPPRTEAQLAQAEAVAPQRRYTPPPQDVVTPAEPAPRRPAGPPRGNARPVIFAHADKVWEEAGKPADVAVVLELRKRMMAELEEQGIKKATSSTALGDWMKDRLNKLNS